MTPEPLLARVGPVAPSRAPLPSAHLRVLRDLDDRLEQVDEVAAVPEAIAEAARHAVGMSTLHLFVFNQRAQPNALLTRCVSEEFSDSYLKPRIAQGFELAGRDLATLEDVMRFARHAVVVNELVSSTELRRTAAYNDFWRPCRVERQLLVALGDRGAPFGFVCLARSASESAFKDRDVTFLNALRHRLEVVLPRDQRPEMANFSAALLSTVEDNCRAIALFDERGGLIWTSVAATSLLSSRSVVLGSQRVILQPTPTLEKWSALVRRHAAHPLERELVEDGVSCRLVPERDGQRLFVVIGTADFRLPGRSEVDHITRRTRLTRREAELALLATQGGSVLNLASALEISENTVRTHLKKVFRKLAVGSRVELAARLRQA